VELTLLVEEVVPLEPAAEAVERLAGLSDPEPHRVHHLPQARHLPGGDDDDDDREQERRRRSSAALLLGSRGLGRSREGGGTRASRAEVLGDWACVRAGVSRAVLE
jgi:hypothetical protein